MLELVKTFFALFALALAVPAIGFSALGLGGSWIARKEEKKRAAIIDMPAQSPTRQKTTKVAG
jgi:hypothetical protein